MTTSASNYFWIWMAILVIVALIALFKVSPFNAAAEPASQGGDEPKPPEET
ncbi:MAG TPA: hypothetical protein VGM90_27140 [Kofleriaceae bacterium]|jgi:hypothetical protein